MIYLNLLFCFILLVFIHEFGHYFVARYFQTEVTDFSIGFGKPLYEYEDKNGTKWKISPIPLGGYVKIKGFDSIFSKNENYEKGSFQNLGLVQKICVLLAGSFFNFLSVFIVLFCMFFIAGSPSIKPIVGKIIEGSAAMESDIRVGDKIINIDDIEIIEFNDISKIISKKNEINITIDRNETFLNKTIKLKFNEDYNKYFLGIAPVNTTEQNIIRNKFNPYLSAKYSFNLIYEIYDFTFSQLSKSFKNNTLQNELAGPIGIIKNAHNLMLDNLGGIFFFFIVISLNIGLINLLPIPLLDGGHIVYFIIRRIFSNSLPEFVTRVYFTVGITIISFLFLVVTFNDIFYK